MLIAVVPVVVTIAAVVVHLQTVNQILVIVFPVAVVAAAVVVAAVIVAVVKIAIILTIFYFQKDILNKQF